MHGPSRSIEPIVGPGSRSSEGTRLHGRWLLLTRMLWVVVVTLSVGLFITASVQYAPQLIAPENFFQASLLHPDPSLSGFFTFYSHPEALMFGSAVGLMSVFTSISSTGISLAWSSGSKPNGSFSASCSACWYLWCSYCLRVSFHL